MTANISPLPWEACGGVVRDAEGIGVCTCDWLVKDRAGSNAALIVRAVNCHEELLDALQELIPLARAAMHDARRDGAEYDIDGELVYARAAIRKARGEQE